MSRFHYRMWRTAAATVAISGSLTACGGGIPVNCLSPEHLGDIRLLEPMEPTIEQARDAMSAVRANAMAFFPDVQSLWFGLVASGALGMQDGVPAFVGAIRDSRGPRAISVPVGHDSVLADSPCLIVVVSPEGDFLFTHQELRSVEPANP
jgi:hypothetical protein